MLLIHNAHIIHEDLTKYFVPLVHFCTCLWTLNFDIVLNCRANRECQLQLACTWRPQTITDGDDTTTPTPGAGITTHAPTSVSVPWPL